MVKHWTRREALASMAFGAGNSLFARTICATEVFHAAHGVPAIGNTHLPTVVAVSRKTLRLRVVPQGKHWTANEVGIVERAWPEPLPPGGTGLMEWGEFMVHLEERSWPMTVLDAAGKSKQQLRLEPSTGATLLALRRTRLWPR